MLTLAEKTAQIARDFGLEARPWAKGSLVRVYAKTGRRDAKVFLEFDDAGDDAGAALKIHIDDCGQSGAWYASQRRELQDRFSPLFFAYVIARYGTSPGPNEESAFGADIREMLAEARAFAAARA